MKAPNIDLSKALQYQIENVQDALRVNGQAGTEAEARALLATLLVSSDLDAAIFRAAELHAKYEKLPDHYQMVVEREITKALVFAEETNGKQPGQAIRQPRQTARGQKAPTTR